MRMFCYGLKQGLKNIGQNRLFSLAAIGTIALCLFLLGTFYVLVSNFQNMVYHAESNVGITVFFEKGVSQSRIDEIGKQIKKCDGVDKIKFISAQKAWEKFQKEMYSGEEKIADSFGKENPLKDSASYEVYLNNVSKQEKISTQIEKIEGVRKVNGSSEIAKGMNRFNLLLAYVSATIIFLLLFVSVFLINTAVATGIRVRKDEISIMKYIGATDAFVKLPFLIEGILIGMIGAIIPLVILGIVYDKVIAFILDHFVVLSQWLTFVSISEEFKVLVPMSILVGVGIGFIGSDLSLRRHLKV